MYKKHLFGGRGGKINSVLDIFREELEDIPNAGTHDQKARIGYYIELRSTWNLIIEVAGSVWPALSFIS